MSSIPNYVASASQTNAAQAVNYQGSNLVDNLRAPTIQPTEDFDHQTFHQNFQVPEEQTKKQQQMLWESSKISRNMGKWQQFSDLGVFEYPEDLHTRLDDPFDEYAKVTLRNSASFALKRLRGPN